MQLNAAGTLGLFASIVIVYDVEGVLNLLIIGGLLDADLPSPSQPSRVQVSVRRFSSDWIWTSCFQLS